MDYFQILTCSGDLGNCCSDVSVAFALGISKRIINILQMVAPIILIIWATIGFIDLMRNPDEANKNLKKVINKFLAAVVVFFVPIFVEALLNMLPTSFSLASCWNQAKVMNEANVNLDLQYEVIEEREKQKIIANPDDYEKGERKPIATTGGNSSNTSRSGNSVVAGSAKGIIDGAEKVHTMYEKDGWAYYSDLGQLFWNDIEKSTNNPSKRTCCATFVGSALYVGGVFTESELNQYNYNLPDDISELCRTHGWIKITNYNDLAAGDIVLMGYGSIDHTQIYAGNGTWYNAGSNWAIQNENPYSYDASDRFLYAWRKSA